VPGCDHKIRSKSDRLLFGREPRSPNAACSAMARGASRFAMTVCYSAQSTRNGHARRRPQSQSAPTSPEGCGFTSFIRMFWARLTIGSCTPRVAAGCGIGSSGRASVCPSALLSPVCGGFMSISDRPSTSSRFDIDERAGVISTSAVENLPRTLMLCPHLRQPCLFRVSGLFIGPGRALSALAFLGALHRCVSDANDGQPIGCLDATPKTARFLLGLR